MTSILGTVYLCLLYGFFVLAGAALKAAGQRRLSRLLELFSIGFAVLVGGMIFLQQHELVEEMKGLWAIITLVLAISAVSSRVANLRGGND